MKHSKLRMRHHCVIVLICTGRILHADVTAVVVFVVMRGGAGTVSIAWM